MYCWEAAKRSPVAIAELLLYRKSTGVILRDALPASKSFALTGRLKTAKCECLWSRANCQVRMFLKQPNRRLQQLLAVENKTILQQPKPSSFYIMFHLTLIFYPHHTGMRSQMLYTNGSFEICQERMFVKQGRTHGWSTYLLSKKIFMLKQKSSNLYMIGFKENFWVIVYPHYIRNRSQWNAMWRDNQPHCYSRSILFPHSAKRVRDCRQNIPWLLWNALLTTPYIK